MFLLKRQLDMAIYYPQGCDDEVIDRVCSPCPSIELGRVRWVAAVHISKQFVNLEDEAEWAAAIAADLVVVIGAVTGTYDGGTASLVPGTGDQPTRKTGKTFKVDFKDFNFIGNHTSYAALENSNNWRIAYGSETYMQLSDRAASWEAKDPIEESDTSERVWAVSASFIQRNAPVPFLRPVPIFTCFGEV